MDDWSDWKLVKTMKKKKLEGTDFKQLEEKICELATKGRRSSSIPKDILVGDRQVFCFRVMEMRLQLSGRQPHKNKRIDKYGSLWSNNDNLWLQAETEEKTHSDIKRARIVAEGFCYTAIFYKNITKHDLTRGTSTHLKGEYILARGKLHWVILKK